MDMSATKIFQAGEVIFKEGDKGDLMYILLEGSVELKVKVEKGEAVIKVFAEPDAHFTLLDIEIRSTGAAPTLQLSGVTAERARAK